jgi:polysaccharide biosynthesis transport protein
MTFRQFLAILRARSWLIAFVFASVLAVVTVASLMMTPRYTASAQVLLDLKSPDPVAGAMLPAHLINSYVATQIELIQSERVATRVVDMLGLADDPAWQARARDAVGDEPGERRRAIANLLVRDIKVRPARDSNMLAVAYSSRDRATVAAVANAFVTAYIDTTVQMRTQPATQTADFFSNQAAQYRGALEQAQQRLTRFRQQRGLVTATEGMDVENMRLRELSTQLTELQAARVDAARRRDTAESALRAGSGDVAEVLGNPLIQTLKGELARAEARLSERGTRLGTNHPEMVMLRQEVASLSDRLQRETAAIAGSLERNHQVALQREQEVREQLERQRSLVMGNTESREQLAALQRDVDLAQRSYDALVERVTQSSLESQATQANVLPIAQAATPLLPSSPNIPLNIGIAVLLGAVLGVLGALVMEAFAARIRGPEDLAFMTGGAPVGVLGAAPVKMLRNARRRAKDRHEPALVSAKVAATGSGAGAAAGPSGPPAAGGTDLRPVSAGGADSAPDALVDAGLLSPAQAERVAKLAEEKGLRFGEAAVESGLVTAEQVNFALSVRQDFPLLDPAASNVAPEVVAAFDANHPFMDDLRMLRTQIKARLHEGGAGASRVVAVVSTADGEGKSFTAANLAVSFAQMGDRTLLIDGDMRTGKLHDLFALGNPVGLSSVLAMQCKPQDALQQVAGLHGLTVLTAGPQAPSPSDLLARNAANYLINAFSNAFDVVIVDTPSAAVRPDASLIVAAARNYVVVARQHQTLSSAVENLSTRLGQLGARMIGSVLVKA